MYFEGRFDRTVDVVVVGFGNAGAIAAMTAVDEGVEVLIVEKQPESLRRPNSRMSGGMFLCPTDVDAAAHYMDGLVRLNGETAETDGAVIRAWAEMTSQNITWLKSMGGSCVQVADHGEHSHVEGYESISVYKPDMGDHPNGTGHRGWGYGLFHFLLDHVNARGVEVLYGASAEWLLTDAAGSVVGLQVSTPGGRISIGASKAVVLACGGFEFNADMKLNYLKAFPTHFYGNPENVGDGIRMSIEVGADLWHMNACAARLVGHFPGSGYPGGVPLDIWGIEEMTGIKILYGDFGGRTQTDEGLRVADDVAVVAPGTERISGGLFTNRHGDRFTNELYRGHTLYYEITDIDSHTLTYPKIPSWWIFDERRRSRSPIVPNFYGPTGPVRQVEWSDDNQPEIDAGWILRGETIEALAHGCHMDATRLARTVDRFNAMCAAGVDDDFGRSERTLAPLSEPPYYAVQMWPGGPNTQGGARRNADSQVMRVTGEPIPGLFAAGEFGSVYGMLYPSGGGNIAECMAFGRLAGHNAAAVRR